MKILEAILFMKIGYHGQEELEEIIKRKKEEEKRGGFTFWGYGGVLCHPANVVQPFAKSFNKPVEVLFSLTPSKFIGTKDKAVEYSGDKEVWKKIPDWAKVTSSKYALTVTGLEKVDIDIGLEKYQIPIGNKKGQLLSNYIRGRVDKAVGQLAENNTEGNLVKINYRAKLIPPYSIFLK